MKRHLTFVHLLILTLCMSTGFSSAQTLDSLQQIARNGNYSEAREMAKSRNDYAGNTDLHFLVGQTYLWEGSQAMAKATFQKVLNNAPAHLEAISALVSIHISEENFTDALQHANEGLSLEGNNEDLLYYKAFALAKMERLSEARTPLDQLLTINPRHEKGLELKESMGVFKVPGSIGVFQSLQWYNDPYERQLYITTIEAPIGDKNVKIIPRFNYASLKIDNDESTGSQVGLDVYPLTGPDSYLYLHYAYSDTEIFPAHRSAAEWFKGAGSGWEFSGGVRYLFWNSHNYFLSASASKYLGKWYPGLNLFYAPKNDNDVTVLASVRRYFNIENSYIHFYLGYGPNPDRTEHQIEFKTTDKPTRFTGGAYTLIHLNGHFYTRVAAEYNKEEYLADNWRNTFMVKAGLEYKF